jgi:hypothetical protein
MHFIRNEAFHGFWFEAQYAPETFYYYTGNLWWSEGTIEPPPSEGFPIEYTIAIATAVIVVAIVGTGAFILRRRPRT